VAAVCIFVFPLLGSVSRDSRSTRPQSAATVAFAGHTLDGSFCQDGTAGCITDDARRAIVHHNPGPGSSSPAGGGLGVGAMLLVAGALLLRMLL